MGRVAFREGTWELDPPAARIADARALAQSPAVAAFVEGTEPYSSAWLVASGQLAELRLWREPSGEVYGYLIQFAGLPAPAQGMVHELQNALSVARAASDLGESAPEGVLQRALSRALVILAQARMEFTPRHSQGLSAVSLEGLVRGVVAEVAVRYPEHSLAVEAEPVTAWADSAVLEQIVANLTLNAVRHGKPPVLVQVTSSETHAVISIHDAGEGIDPSSFAAGTLSLASPGSGLGLPIVLVLAEQQGLDISWGPGRVSLTLPRLDPAVTSDSPSDLGAG